MSGYESPLEWALRNLLDTNWASERLINQLSPLSCSMPSTNIYRALTMYQGRLHLTGDKHINIGPLCHGQVPRGQTAESGGRKLWGQGVPFQLMCSRMVSEWRATGDKLGRGGHVALWGKAFLVEEAWGWEQVWGVWDKARRPVWLGLRNCHRSS